MSESFYSNRYNKNVWLTNHAIESMSKRSITLQEVIILIEEGTLKSKDGKNGWIFHHFENRDDNLICAAVISEQSFIVKTIMINWKQRKTNENSIL